MYWKSLSSAGWWRTSARKQSRLSWYVSAEDVGCSPPSSLGPYRSVSGMFRRAEESAIAGSSLGSKAAFHHRLNSNRYIVPKVQEICFKAFVKESTNGRSASRMTPPDIVLLSEYSTSRRRHISKYPATHITYICKIANDNIRKIPVT